MKSTSAAFFRCVTKGVEGVVLGVISWGSGCLLVEEPEAVIWYRRILNTFQPTYSKTLTTSELEDYFNLSNTEE